jgi:hypothetical protein
MQDRKGPMKTAQGPCRSKEIRALTSSSSEVLLKGQIELSHGLFDATRRMDSNRIKRLVNKRVELA